MREREVFKVIVANQNYYSICFDGFSREQEGNMQFSVKGLLSSFYLAIGKDVLHMPTSVVMVPKADVMAILNGCLISHITVFLLEIDPDWPGPIS